MTSLLKKRDINWTHLINQHTTDIRTTVDRYTTDSSPIYHRHMTDSKSRCVVEISTDTRPIVYLTIDRLSTDYRPTIDRPSTDYQPTIDRLSTDCRPTIDRLSTDCRPLYRPLCRPLCRPISQSTLPTLNKILKIFIMNRYISKGYATS